MRKSMIPNLFTFINLSFGILSLLCMFNRKFTIAAIFILCAALVDRYDGKIARMLNVTSDLGKELDSLADLVSFGVAPSMLCYFIYGLRYDGVLGFLWILILFLFPICGAYRLARYNTTEFTGTFAGIPITVTGSTLAILALLSIQIQINASIMYILIALLSYLMVSSISFKKI